MAKTYAADDYSFIQKRLHELSKDKKTILGRVDADQTEYDFEMSCPGARAIFRALTGRAQARAAKWTQEMDGSYRKVAPSVEAKLLSEGFTIRYV